MNSYGVNAQADAHAIWSNGGLEPAAGDSGRNPMKGPNSTVKPEISAGHPSLYDTYAREQSPCDPITNYAERRGI